MYADQATETKLVNAIKEAAQRIEYADPIDPEAILADCLKRRDLSEGFAKTATDALNKSYSVHYMSTHDDSDRDADHRLLDSEKVKMHMCAEDTPTCPKTGVPIDEPVYVEVKRVTMTPKAASVNTAENNPAKYELNKEYLDKLTLGLHKLAKGFDTFYADTFRATENLYGRHKQASEMDMDDYTVQCLFSHGHQDTNELMNSIGLYKKASKVAMFGTGKVVEMPRIIPDNETSRTIYGLVKDAYIVNTAHKSVNYILKEAGDLNECLQGLIQKYEDICMGKTAASDDGRLNDQIATTSGNIVGAIPGFAAGVIGGTTGGLMNLLENATSAANNNLKSFDSAEVIDTKLINEDRRIKNLEAWAEVAADRELARYPITDLFEVTQKLIKANPSFERPDAAPMLVDTVKQVMSQGQNIGLALHGATAKTLSDIAKSRGSNITGNDLYGVRSMITGKKEPGQYYNITGMFMRPIAEGSKMLGESVVDLGSTAVKDITNLGLTVADRASETNRLKRELERTKLQQELEKLNEVPSEQEELLKALKLENALEDHKAKIESRQERANEKAKAEADLANKAQFTAEQQAASAEILQIANDPNTPKAIRQAIAKALATNEASIINAYMADPSVLNDKNKMDFLMAVPALGNNIDALNSLSKHPDILKHDKAVDGIRNVFNSRGTKSDLQKKLIINNPMQMAALYDKAGKSSAKGLPSGNASGNTTGNSKFSKGTSAGTPSNTPESWLHKLDSRVRAASGYQDKRDVLSDAYDMLQDHQKEEFKKYFGVSDDTDAKDILYSYYNL